MLPDLRQTTLAPVGDVERISGYPAEAVPDPDLAYEYATAQSLQAGAPAPNSSATK